MKKVDFVVTGGFPITLDDFKYADDAIREAIMAIIKSQIGTATSAIITGCSITEDDTYYYVSAGWLFMNDNFYEVKTQQCLKNSGTGGYYWIVDSSTDPDGLKSFEDGSSVNVYKIENAVLTYSDTTPAAGTYCPMNADDIVTIWKSRLSLTEILGVPYSVDLTADNVSSSTLTLSAISGKLEYKIIGKTILIDFALNVNVNSVDTSPGSIIVNLPANIVPTTDNDTVVPITMYQFVGNYTAYFCRLNGNTLVLTPNATSSYAATVQSFQGQMFFTIQ